MTGLGWSEMAYHLVDTISLVSANRRPSSQLWSRNGDRDSPALRCAALRKQRSLPHVHKSGSRHQMLRTVARVSSGRVPCFADADAVFLAPGA